MANYSKPQGSQTMANNSMTNFITVKQNIEKELQQEESHIKSNPTCTELVSLRNLEDFNDIAKNWDLKENNLVLQSFYREGKRAKDIVSGNDLEYQLVKKFGKDIQQTINLTGPMNLNEKILDAKNLAEKMFGKGKLTLQDLCITRSIILIQQLYQQISDMADLNEATRKEMLMQRESSIKTKKDFLTMIEDLYGKCSKNLLGNGENLGGVNSADLFTLKSQLGQLKSQVNNQINQEKELDKKFENLAKLHNNELQAKLNNLENTVSQKVDEYERKKAASMNLIRMDVDDEVKIKNDTQDKKIVTLERDVGILKEQLNNNVKVQDQLIETNKSDLMAAIKVQENRINNVAKNYNMLLKKMEETNKSSEWVHKPEISVEEIKTLIETQLDAKTKGTILKMTSLENELSTFKNVTMGQIAGQKVLELKQELDKKEVEKDYSNQIKGIEKKEKDRDNKIKKLEEDMVKVLAEIENLKKICDEDKAEKSEMKNIKEELEKEQKKIKEDLGKKANKTSTDSLINEQKSSLKTLTENVDELSKKLEEDIDYIKVVLNVNDIMEDNKENRDTSKDIFKINKRPVRDNKETKEVSLKKRVDNLVRQNFNDKKELNDKIKQISDDIEKAKLKELKDEVSMLLGTLEDIKNTVDENNKKVIKCEADIKILNDDKEEESLNNEIKLAEKSIKKLENQMSEHLEKLEEINKVNQINKEKEKISNELKEKEKIEKENEMVKYKKEIETKMEFMSRQWEEFKKGNKKEWETFKVENNLKDEWSEFQKKNKVIIAKEQEKTLKDSLKTTRKKKLEEIANTANLEEISQGSNAEVIAEKIDRAIKTYNFISINDLLAFKYVKQEEVIALLEKNKEEILKEWNTEQTAIELLLNNMKTENMNFQIIKKNYIDEKNRILEDYENMNEELKKNIVELKGLQNKQEMINTDLKEKNKNLFDSSFNINEKNRYLFTSNNNINNINESNLFNNSRNNKNSNIFDNKSNEPIFNLFGDETKKDNNINIFNNNNPQNLGLFGNSNNNNNNLEHNERNNIFNFSLSQSFQGREKSEENNIKKLTQEIISTNVKNNNIINSNNNQKNFMIGSNNNNHINGLNNSNDVKNNLAKWRDMQNSNNNKKNNEESNKKISQEEKEKKLFETGYQVMEKCSFQFSDLCLNLPDEIWTKLSPQEKKGFFRVKDNYIEERLKMINSDERLMEEEKEDSKKMIEEMRHKIPIIVNGEIKGYKNTKGNYKGGNFRGVRNRKERWKENNGQSAQNKNNEQNNNQNNNKQSNNSMQQNRQGNRGRRYWNPRRNRRRNNYRNVRRYGRRRNYRRRWRDYRRRNQNHSRRSYGRRRYNRYNRSRRTFGRRRNNYRRPRRRYYKNRRRGKYQNRNRNWNPDWNKRWNRRNRPNKGRRPFRNNSH